jgi:hypothetical protein
MFGVEPLLHLTIDLSLTFRVSLLLLARRKGRQRDDEQQGKNVFHGKDLDYKCAAIFEQLFSFAGTDLIPLPIAAHGSGSCWTSPPARLSASKPLAGSEN